MWASVRVGKKGAYPATFVVVNFRKKGPLGKWRKYKSEVNLRGFMDYSNGERIICGAATTLSGRGDVSFDAIARYPNPYPCKAQKMEIRYRGINSVVYLLDIDTSKL